MKPTIGRIVHYEHEGQTLPAIVTNVVGEDLVNLQIFKDGLGGCYFHEGVAKGTGEGCWRWPEIQPTSFTVPAPTGGVVSGMPPVSNKP